MEIKDIKPNTGKIDVVLNIVEKEEPRTFEKFGKKGKVCNVVVEDETGKIKMTLWNEDIDKIKTGDKVHLQNGWCSEYKGEKQLSTGKFGKIEVLEHGEEKTVFTNDPAVLGVAPQSDEGDDDDDEEEAVGEEEFVE